MLLLVVALDDNHGEAFLAEAAHVLHDARRVGALVQEVTDRDEDVRLRQAHLLDEGVQFPQHSVHVADDYSARHSCPPAPSTLERH